MSPDDLVIHAAILNPVSEANTKLVSFLVSACPALVNVRSLHGITPLILACRLGRTDYVKILLEAGADQSSKDSGCANLLHSALHFRPKAPKLKALLDVLDRSLVISMMTERCTLDDDARTPLHQWIHGQCKGNNYYKVEQAIEVLNFLMDLSPEAGKRALWMVDGTGDTPLHALVSSNASEKIVKAVLDIDPELLFRENAVGRTPLEVAHDRFFADKSKAPSDRSWYPSRDPQEPSLVTTHLTSFVDRAADELEDKSHIAVVWKLCSEYELKAVSKKRRLASLHEANDVAERLGGAYMGDRYQFRLPVVEAADEEGEGEGKKAVCDEKKKFADFVSERYAGNYDAWDASKEPREPKEPGQCVCGGCHY